MKLVNNSKEFELLYPYSEGNPKECKHPKKYPCLVEWIQHDGGVGGSYHSCEIIYMPNDVDSYSFIQGVCAKTEVLIPVH